MKFILLNFDVPQTKPTLIDKVINYSRIKIRI